MRIRYLLGVALIALFAVPGTASQLAARAAATEPLAAAAFSDPDVAPTFSITLPTRFVAPSDFDTASLQHFAG